MIPIKKEQGVSYYSVSGELMLETRYSRGTPFSNGYSVVNGDNPDRYGVCNQAGELVVPYGYESIRYDVDSNGYFVAEKKNGKLGIVNVDSEEFIFGVYTIVSPIQNDFSTVYNKTSWGLVDLEGNEAIRPMFSDIRVSGNLAICSDKEKRQIVVVDVRKNSTTVRLSDVDYITSNYFGIFLENSGKIELYDHVSYRKLSPLIECIICANDSYEEGLAGVQMVGGGCGYIDSNTLEMAIDPIWDSVDPFFEGLATVTKGDKVGAINRKGELVVDCICDSLGYFSYGFSEYELLGGESGYFDSRGKKIVFDD